MLLAAASFTSAALVPPPCGGTFAAVGGRSRLGCSPRCCAIYDESTGGFVEVSSEQVAAAKAARERAAAEQAAKARVEAAASASKPRRLTYLQRSAIKARISQLERENEEREAEISRLKVQLGRAGQRRVGWQGEFSRFSEQEAAKVGKATEVLIKSLQRQNDPLGYLASEAQAILRMGTNYSLISRYIIAGAATVDADNLVAHVPAIYSRARELEPYAPGLLPVVERWLPVRTTLGGFRLGREAGTHSWPATLPVFAPVQGTG